MTSTPNSPENQTFSSPLDSWDDLADNPTENPPSLWPIPLDASLELSGVPAPEALMPSPGVFCLPEAPSSVQSVVSILLADELKLGDRMDDHLRDAIRDAIAWLELAYP